MSKLRILLGLFALLGVFAGCKEDDPPTYGNVWVMHAILDGPTVNVQVDGTTVYDNLVFPSSTPTYEVVEAGNRTLSVLTGTTTYASVSQNVETDKSYSAFLNLDNAGAPRLTVFPDDLTAPAAGKAHLRVVNMCKNAPNLDLGSFSGTTITSVNAKFAGIGYNKATTFVALDAASFDYAVVSSGSPTTVGAHIILEDLLLSAGKIYTLVIYGDATSSDPAKQFGYVVVTNN